MNIFSTGLACDCEDHNPEHGKDGKVESYIEEKKRISGMEIQEEENYEMDFEIWPVEHPMEPPDEDRPVKCPMPESSVINVSNFSQNDEGKREKKLAESLRKRAEENSAEKKSKKEENLSTTVRAVRKRHHTLTGGNENDQHIIVPFSRVHPQPPQNLNIFQMLHQIEKLE